MRSFSHVQLFATLWTVAYQAPPSMEFSRQEYWSGLPFPSPWDLPHPGIEPGSPALRADSLPSELQGKPHINIYPLPFRPPSQPAPSCPSRPSQSTGLSFLGHTAASHCCLFYAWQHIHANATLSICPPFPSPAVSTSPFSALCLYSCPEIGSSVSLF